ncbi:cytidine deaminase [bacterium]|nr:cytidine deaminase [bacterium]
MIQQAQQLAVAPISNFLVGAVGRGASGREYPGFNMEFAGLGLQHTVHAEQAVLAMAHAGGESALLELEVTHAPCGHCRQFLRELAAPLTVILPNGRFTLEELLPYSFGPDDLGVSGGMLSNPSVLVGEGPELARAAAEKSWSPYSKMRAGVAIRCGQQWFGGAYLENAAFNPSLNPAQYALILARAAGFTQVDESLFYGDEGLYGASLAVLPAIRRL